jgi:hypothetical protein
MNRSQTGAAGRARTRSSIGRSSDPSVRNQPLTQPRRAAASSLVARIVGVVGCLAVAAIHVIDQGGIPGTKGPEYVQILYYALEVAGVLAAVLLLTKHVRSAWLLSLAVAAGPIVGYVLSRGPGLPNYTDDVGNWGEPLGVVSLIVEGILLILAAVLLRRYASSANSPAPVGR